MVEKFIKTCAELAPIAQDGLEIIIIKRMLEAIHIISNNVVEFTRNFKEAFDVKQICTILEINKNRYNYLKRHGQLDWHIAKIGGYVTDRLDVKK